MLVLTMSLSLACTSEEAGESTGQTRLALEFDPKLPWLNVKRALTLEDLMGKVVILDFWTYGCINCIHVLADLRRLEHEYGNKLAVIGIHTPKFDNEKNLETLRSILVRYDIEHPVVNDVEFTLAEYYGMRAWPTQVVIDPRGQIVGGVRGEGNYELLAKTTEALLREHAAEIDTRPLPLSLEKHRLKTSLLAAPGKIASSDRYVAIADTLHHRVIVTDHTGKIQKIIGDATAGFRDGAAREARFFSPQGLVLTRDGIYVADTGNHAIRHIRLPNGQVQTVAGNGENEIHFRGDFDALAIGLRSPWALAMHGSELYIAMAGMHQIWRLDLKTKKIGPFAGSGREGIADGSLDFAKFSQPSGLSLKGNWLYVADAEDSAVRRIHLEREHVETLVGRGLFDFGDRDGSFQSARLQHVLGVAVLDESQVLVADTYNHKLKLLDLERREVKTLAGTGQPGNKDGSAEKAMMNEPGGLTVVGRRVLIADTNNHRIVQFDLQSRRLAEWPLTP